MTTQLHLKPWVVSRLEGHTFAWVDVNSFRYRQDAEDYLRLLQQLRPDIKYEINFRSGR